METGVRNGAPVDLRTQSVGVTEAAAGIEAVAGIDLEWAGQVEAAAAGIDLGLAGQVEAVDEPAVQSYSHLGNP